MTLACPKDWGSSKRPTGYRRDRCIGPEIGDEEKTSMKLSEPMTLMPMLTPVHAW